MRKVFGEREKTQPITHEIERHQHRHRHRRTCLCDFNIFAVINPFLWVSHIHTFIVCVVGSLVVGTIKWANRTDALDTNNVYEHTFYLDRNKWAWYVCALCVCFDVSKSKQSLQLKGLLSFDRQLFLLKANGVPWFSGKTRRQPSVSHPSPPPISFATVTAVILDACYVLYDRMCTTATAKQNCDGPEWQSHTNEFNDKYTRTLTSKITVFNACCLQ